jgi:hypothetical protein
MTNAIKSAVKLLVKDEKRGFADLYIKNAVAYYAVVHNPKDKYKAANREQEYTITVFVDEAAKLALDELALNKEFKLVNKDRNKKRAIKYPLEQYPECEGLYGASFSLPSLTKAGAPRKPVVCWDNGNNSQDVLGEPKKGGELCPELIGNGSIVSLKLSCYKNEDELLNTSLNTVAVSKLIAFSGGSGTTHDAEFGFDIDYASARAQASEKAKPNEAAMFGDDDENY